MSARYSTSPTLRLRIAESPTRRIAAALLVVAFTAAVLHTALYGYPWLALALLTLQIGVLIRARQFDVEGAVLAWNAGRWTLEQGSHCRSIALQRAHCLPWVTYLCWREDNGLNRQLWFFADASDRHQLRRLRVRLTIEG